MRKKSKVVKIKFPTQLIWDIWKISEENGLTFEETVLKMLWAAVTEYKYEKDKENY